jgi:hypothetical protein
MELQLMKLLVYSFSAMVLALFIYISALAAFFYIKIRDLQHTIKDNKKEENGLNF